MNHAFTVEKGPRDAVIRQLSQDNDPGLYPEMLILKTANSQLKFGFSKMRFQMHLELLVRLQQILKHARYKEWWLSAFVIMLGLALCLEEYQHRLHVQADGNIARGEEREQAVRDAQNSCSNIDDAFEFMLRLYHYKYSVRSQHQASFALWKDRTTHYAEAEFVESISLMFTRHRMWSLISQLGHQTLTENTGIVLLQRKDLEVLVSEDNHVLRFVGRLLTSVM